jgi:hypothetical protein
VELNTYYAYDDGSVNATSAAFFRMVLCCLPFRPEPTGLRAGLRLVPVFTVTWGTRQVTIKVWACVQLPDDANVLRSKPVVREGLPGNKATFK